MHIVVLNESGKETTTGVTLFAGSEEEDPYKYLPYEEVNCLDRGLHVVVDAASSGALNRANAQSWASNTISYVSRG